VNPNDHSPAPLAASFLPTVEADDPEGIWIRFRPEEGPLLVRKSDWIGFDLDGTLSRTDNPGHFEPPYPIGEPIAEMVAVAKALLEAGVKVKIFSARACEAASIPVVQAWAEKQGLGRLEVTNEKDFDLRRFYDDRAIPIPGKTA